MRQYSFLLILLFLLSACGNKDEKTIISGNVSFGEGEYVQLHQYEFDRSLLLDSVKIKKDGHFRFKMKQQEPGFYIINTENNDYAVLLLKPRDKVELTGDYFNLGKSYKIIGSEDCEQIRQLDILLFNIQKKIDSLLIVYEACKNDPNFDSIRLSLDQTYMKILKTHHDSTIAFIIRNMNSLVSIYALQQKYDEQTYVLNRYRDLQYYNIVYQSLLKEYPGITLLKLLENKINQIQSYYNQQKLIHMAANSATPIPEVKLPSPDGDTISLLTTLKNSKFILLYFWASWDPASINQNIELKKAYAKYHHKGLEIYGISLDTDKEKWKQAIKYDSLSWIQVSDLSYPNSTITQLYNISKIPSNYLISQNGDILAKNLRSDRMWDHLATAFNE